MLRLSTRLAVIAGSYLLVALAVLAHLWWNGRPVQLANVPGGRVQCVSYTPPDSLPWEEKVTSIERIRADLAHLAKYTRCVRTYSVSDGLDRVPEVARALDLKVMLGIWIGLDKKHNEKEMARGLAVIREYHDVIDSVVVGNEVLLRRDQTRDALRGYIRRVRAATDLPVTYADVWEFWLKNRQLAPEVSFVTVHMLPYWENEPVPIERAVTHIGRVLARVQAAFPDKHIYIGEAGWPSFGRQRAGAVPSRVNEARFFREFTAYADRHDVHYNFIEAFDQPWKRKLEGTVGGQWGLFDVNSQVKFPLTGPVQNDPHWKLPVLAALIAAMVVAAVMGWLWRGSKAWRAVALAALAAYSAGAIVVLQARYLVAANRTIWEWLGSLTWYASGWIVYACTTGLLVMACRSNAEDRSLPGAVHWRDALTRGWHRGAGLRALLSIARLVYLFGLAYIALLLTLDPRYRDFPLVAAVLPGIALSLHALVSVCTTRAEHPLEELLLSYWLVVASVWIALAEGFENVQSLLWCALNLGVALTFVWNARRARDAQRAAEQPERGEFDPV